MGVGEILDELLDARVSRGFGGLFYGVYAGVVSDISDPQGQGRVKVKLPWSPDGDGQAYEAWARLATLMAGNNRGSWFVPDLGDEVLLAFEAGDPRRPYVVGSLWNGQDAPPQSMDGAGRNPRDLYRVDLAAMTSKWIGETEKNLSAILGAAEHADVLLFFDEADALFAARTDVGDSNDRFANAQTNYLLTRIEEFDGIALLASNSRDRFDPAFVRRLDAILDFPMPEAP